MKKHLFQLGQIEDLSITERARHILSDDDIQSIIDQVNDEILNYQDSYAHYVGAEGTRQFIGSSYVDYELIGKNILFID